MAKKEQLTPEQVIEALTATGGLAYVAAERLGVSARTVYNYANRYATVREAIQHQKGKRLDAAEASLWKAVLAGEAWAVCFYLKTQGKERGYVERTELGGNVVVRKEIVEEIVDDSRPDHQTNGEATPGSGGVPPF
jgi:hypothetical protein